MARLTVVPTPIGHLEDITLRALAALRDADVLACEDTRVTRKIFARHEIPVPSTTVAYHEHNEERAGRKLLEYLEAGRSVTLCTDAGMPGVSDPGYRLVSAASEAGFEVTVLPGPSAVSTALVASGLPTSSYVFLGFPPKKPGKLRNFLAAEADKPHTMVLYESPHRIGKLLAAALDALGDRRCAVCLELTKMHERVVRGWTSDLADAFAAPVKGEATVVLAGNHPKFARPATPGSGDPGSGP